MPLTSEQLTAMNNPIKIQGNAARANSATIFILPFSQLLPVALILSQASAGFNPRSFFFCRFVL
ncbi:MAG: hypothetical protein HFF88_05670 [Oscillibacter sp.]|nr:hypothetical protein [Oscillibacter sp.]